MEITGGVPAGRTTGVHHIQEQTYNQLSTVMSRINKKTNARFIGDSSSVQEGEVRRELPPAVEQTGGIKRKKIKK